ncbi:flagellar export chaperone FliS [Rubrivivax gelatinosus]|nr:flagellar export chaperone FliS [Rubrivivax gelatinosus]
MIQDAYHSYHAVDLGARTAQASPVQLVLILTDGLLEELARARAHIVGRRYEAKARSLDKCVNILNGLSSALDFDQGGEIVQNLERLYDFCAQQLYKAGQQLEPKYIDEVVGLLQTLRNGWQGLQARHG